MKLTGGKLIIKTACLSNNYFGIWYYKKLCCPTNFRFLVQLADLMIIKCTKIKMIWFLILVLDWGYLLGALSGLVKGGGVQKREKNRIVLCYKSLEWLMAPRVVSLRLDWFSYRYFHVVSLRRFLWSVHTCPIFCLNRWLGDFYDCFDSQIFYIVPNSDILGVNGGISESNFRKKDLKYDSLWQTKGHLRIYFWFFFWFCSGFFFFFIFSKAITHHMLLFVKYHIQCYLIDYMFSLI